MGIKEVLKGFKEGQQRRKDMIKQLDEQMRIQKLVEDRQKSANERELERYFKENREKTIKQQLEIARKKRDEDIKFGHNPINTPNIMKAKWEVMKEKNMFSGKGNMFSNQDFIHKSNNKLMNNGNILKGRNILRC
ncbi:MAG: hypothetical protein ACOC3V_01650 [bacterium]